MRLANVRIDPVGAEGREGREGHGDAEMVPTRHSLRQ